MTKIYKVLICDLIGLKFDADGKPDPSEVRDHIERTGNQFHILDQSDLVEPPDGLIHFYYFPEISTEAEILSLTDQGQYDAVIAAATFLPRNSRFPLGGVRIGAGTGNMQCECWGGASGTGGEAPLMNTPGFNSRATAQMAMKALLRVRPDLPVAELHRRSVAGTFDTGKHLRDFPTAKLEGQTAAVLGYGNIGREFAKLAGAFGMKVKIYARAHHKARIEADGFTFAKSPETAADGADVLSIHIGLGIDNANIGFVSDSILAQLNHNAVLINYDRGECIDIAALDRAMTSSRVAHAAIDADIFVEPDGSLRGPLVPYLALDKKYQGRLELLPHAAADTDHPSRVAGAKQAVDQIVDCIRNKRVTNLKGDLPPGFENAGVKLGV